MSQQSAAHTLIALFKEMSELKASDLHLVAGNSPTYRFHGGLYPSSMRSPISAEQVEVLCRSILINNQVDELEKHGEVDVTFGVKDVGRFRGNIFFQMGTLSAVFRRISDVVPQLESYDLSASFLKIMSHPFGLILVTGSSGSGKTTTLASMIDYYNRTKHLHILTIEQPIEYVHQSKKSLINHREVGEDTETFGTALRSALREDPDIILVGEMRDQETIEATIKLAETGHLVFSTLHTNTSSDTIMRLTHCFPAGMQDEIRLKLSLILKGVITQALVPKLDKKGVVLATEVLLMTPAISNLIRENKIHQIASSMAGQPGMMTLNQSLLQLYESGEITRDTALEYSPNPDELLNRMRKPQAA